MKAQPCPSPEALRAFAVGNLAEADLSEIEEHLSDCQDCDSALRALDDKTDPFVDQLRKLPDRNPDSDNAVATNLIAGARAAYASGSTSPPGAELVSDPGSKIAGLLAQGPVRLGRFELLAELGVGSFGYVFRARDTELDRDVAIKIQRGGNLTDRRAGSPVWRQSSCEGPSVP